MRLRLLILAGLLALVPGVQAGAQVSPDDARRTLEVLQDPQKRDQLVTTLKTIAQAQQPAHSGACCRADRPWQSRRRGADGRLRVHEPRFRRDDRRFQGDPQRAAAMGLAAGDGDRPLGARRPAGHRLATGAGAGGRSRGRVGGAPCHTAPDPGSGPPGPRRRRAGGRRRRSKRRKRRDRIASPPPRHGAHPAAARAAGARPLWPRTVAGARLPGGRAPGRGDRARRRGSATSRAPRGDRCLRVLRRHPVRRAGIVLPRPAAPAPADDTRPHGRLRHALDLAHRRGQRVRLRHRRGRSAARPVGRRARCTVEDGRAGRSHLSRHHRPAAAPDGTAGDPRPRRTRAARSRRCETGWRASGTGWRCCCWRRCGSPGRSRCSTATPACCATSAASSWSSFWRGSRRSSSLERSTARWRRVPMPCRAFQGSMRASHSITP